MEVLLLDDSLLSKLTADNWPTIGWFKKDLLPYKGFIFIGLIIVNNEPKVIEYNVRMGDPETEVVLPRIETDLMEIFSCNKRSKVDKISLSVNPKSATTVVLVSGGILNL